MKTISRKMIILCIAVITLLVFLYNFGWLRPVENIFTKGMNYFLTRAYSVSAVVNNTFSSQAQRADLSSLAEQQNEQIRELTKANADLRMVEEENGILRQQLGFFAKYKFKYLLSNVISRGDITDSSGQIETIIIDKGSRDGLVVGLPALSGDGVIIGRIAEVKDNLAKIYLTNNPKCKLAVTILNENKTSGVAEGELGLTVRMNFIPQNVVLRTNDIVITSGMEKLIPRGLVVGRVLEVQKENNELWQTASLEPLVNGDDLIIVSIIIP